MMKVKYLDWRCEKILSSRQALMMRESSNSAIICTVSPDKIHKTDCLLMYLINLSDRSL